MLWYLASIGTAMMKGTSTNEAMTSVSARAWPSCRVPGLHMREAFMSGRSVEYTKGCTAMSARCNRIGAFGITYLIQPNLPVRAVHAGILEAAVGTRRPTKIDP